MILLLRLGVCRCIGTHSPSLFCAVHCRLVVAPLARLVFEQERREGDLRYAHLRLRWAAGDCSDGLLWEK